MTKDDIKNEFLTKSKMTKIIESTIELVKDNDLLNTFEYINVAVEDQ